MTPVDLKAPPVDKDAQDAEAGDRVERLLADPAVEERFQKLRAKWYDQWVKEEDAEKRQVLWVKSKVLDEVKAAIHTVVSDGQMAKNALNRRQNR